jgi:hypothetical protein
MLPKRTTPTPPRYVPAEPCGNLGLMRYAGRHRVLLCLIVRPTPVAALVCILAMDRYTVLEGTS